MEDNRSLRKSCVKIPLFSLLLKEKNERKIRLEIQTLHLQYWISNMALTQVDVRSRHGLGYFCSRGYKSTEEEESSCPGLQHIEEGSRRHVCTDRHRTTGPAILIIKKNSGARKDEGNWFVFFFFFVLHLEMK